MSVNLFDVNYYRAANSDLAGLNDAQAWSHFQTYGLNEGRAFSSLVNLNFYRASNADLASFSYRQAYEHLQNYGVAEGRRFSSLVDLSFYRAYNSDLAGFNNRQAYEHLQNHGIAEGRRFSSLVDLNIYRAANPDLSAIGFNNKQLFEHLATYGANEGRRFSVAFDSSHYRRVNSDLARAGLNNTQLLEHFERYGLGEGRTSSESFSVSYYLANNSDLRALKFTSRQAHQHFEVYGFREGRLGAASGQVSVPTDPGNTLNSAFNLGILSRGNRSVREFVSSVDREDYYRFTLGRHNTFRLTLNDLSMNADVELLDSNGNLIHGSYNGGNLAESIRHTLTAGTYYVRVYRDSDANTNYNLSLSATSTIDPTVGTAPASGNNSIDALWNQSRSYWNTSSNGGVITYSFYSNASGSYYGSEIVSEVSEAIKYNVRGILKSLESFINVSFREVADTASSFGVLRYMFSNGASYAYAYYPSFGDIGGDVHLNSNPNFQFSGSPGTSGYATLIHETLHALGLKHPGNYGTFREEPFLTGNEDNTTNTVMSYNSASNDSVTAMAYDIRALQYLYGVRSYNSTNTTYSFSTVYSYTIGSQFFGSTTTQSKQAIWDSGGIDTLDFSALSSSMNYRFDLREGGILTTQQAYNGTPYRDLTTGEFYTTSTFGTTIAYNTVIENLINSRGNDYIIANSAANIFRGYTFGTYTGNDVFEFTNSSDVLDLSGYGISNLTASSNSSDLTINLGIYGSVQIKNYYGSSGSMRILIGSNYYTYSFSGSWQLL